MNTNLITTYADNMENALDRRGWNYDYSVLKNMAEKSVCAKESLYNLFSKHVNWNPNKGMIQFDADINRPFSHMAIYNFLQFMNNKILFNNIDIDSNKWDKLYSAIYRINSQYLKDCTDNEIADKLNAINATYRIRPEMRASKVIGKVMRTECLDQVEGYGKMFSSLCDDINPLTIRRHTVISLNPVDFLLMSNGDTWESCHNIEDPDDPGCYCAGTISYMLDNFSFLFYTVDASYNGNDIEFEPKVSRQVFAYKEGVLFQSRMYPQSCDCGAEEMYKDTREIVQKVISDCENFNNLWITSKTNVEEVVSKEYDAQCYPDWRNGCPGSSHCRISRQKEMETSHVKIRIGKKPICIECGSEHTNHETINCCTGGYYCECCGDRIDRDDVYWVGDYPYCYDCVEQCDDCGEWVVNGDLRETYDGRRVCECCFDNDYYYCDDIEDNVHRGNTITLENGDTYYTENKGITWEYCAECGGAYPIEDMVEINGKYYCEYCEERVECEESDDDEDDEAV